MSLIDGIELQRLSYWQGQTLRSRDFKDQAALDEYRCMLHNAVLHERGGVSFGLEVGPGTGPNTVTVQCGMAYDCAGRALILQESRGIGPAPQGAAWLVLAARSGRGGRGTCCGGEEEPGCGPAGARDLDLDVELSWRGGASHEPIDGIVLARASGGKLDTAFRPRSVRRYARPHLARGNTVRGHTPWERWIVEGGTVAGVQTHIDTSAAGFTKTPCYFATLDGSGWELAGTEFAPAFFPHVADPTPDGFTFRLLLIEVARRRYKAAFGTARPGEVARVSADRIRVKLDDMSSVRVGDAVALLRPRALEAYQIAALSGSTVTLKSALPPAVPEEVVVGVGNAPRAATITAVTGSKPDVEVSLDPAVVLKKGDVIVRLSDLATALVSKGGSGTIEVKEPFAGWTKEDKVGVARPASAVAVKSATTDGPKTVVVLAQSASVMTAGEAVVLLGQKKTPLGAGRVTQATGTTIEVQPPLSKTDTAEVRQVAAVSREVAVQALRPLTQGITVTVDAPGVFDEGDFVADTKDLSRITRVEEISGSRLTLQSDIQTEQGGMLVAANWTSATTVQQAPADPAGPTRVTVGRAGAASTGSFVCRRKGDELSAPALVTEASGASLTLDPPIAGLTKLDELVVGTFPRIMTVVGQSHPDQVQVAGAPELAGGDVIMLLGDSPSPVRLAEVVSVSGSTIFLRGEWPGLQAGSLLGTAHLRDVAKARRLADRAKIKLDADLRPGTDFVVIPTHYVDTSEGAVVESIGAGSVVTLAGGDGIVPADWLHGAALGPAALGPQPLLTLESADGLEPGPVTVAGLDLISREFRMTTARLAVQEPANARVSVVIDAGGPYRFRPETLSLVTTFNSGFVDAFATFAQRQMLTVGWIGCQEGIPRLTDCPAVVPDVEACGDAVAATEEVAHVDVQ